MKKLQLLSALCAIVLLGVAACDADGTYPTTDNAVVTNPDTSEPDAGTTQPDTSTEPDVTTTPDISTEPDAGTPTNDPCEDYEWLLVDENGNPIQWECVKWADGDIELQLEERDGVCWMISNLFEKPASWFTFYPPDRFVDHVEPPFGDADCIPL